MARNRTTGRPIPTPNGRVSLKALGQIVRTRSVLSGLEVFHEALGPVFQANLPSFRPIMMAGPDANRWILVTQQKALNWNAPTDPIARLLRDGLLVADGDTHDDMRKGMNPALHRSAFGPYVETMIRVTDQVIDSWTPGQTVDMLRAMREIALLVIMQTMFSDDFTPELAAYWRAVIAVLNYISPGLWMFWAGIPRPGYAAHFRKLDAYLMALIRARRAQATTGEKPPRDLLGILIDMNASDAMIRDQMMTMIVAGHDTSTGLLSWAMYMLGLRLDIYQRTRDEVDNILSGQPATLQDVAELRYLDRLCDETMRLYPPAHLGSRIAARELEYDGYVIPAGARVTYSIYVTHRMKAYWERPHDFDPDRFLPERSKSRPPYCFVPFGGGQRNCIGAAFAQVEAKVILSRVLQRCTFRLLRQSVHEHMAVTIEPRPGVFMEVQKR
jgi:cytochrome P450